MIDGRENLSLPASSKISDLQLVLCNGVNLSSVTRRLYLKFHKQLDTRMPSAA